MKNIIFSIITSSLLLNCQAFAVVVDVPNLNVYIKEEEDGQSIPAQVYRAQQYVQRKCFELLETFEIISSRMSEEEGFEPPLPCGKSVFETDAFSRSATLPEELRAFIACQKWA